MTVEELIEELEKIEDKSMIVCRNRDWEDVKIEEVYVDDTYTPPVVVLT